MALKTDYKDDGFAGNRKYRMITNADGTMSFEDVTPYDPVGDSFGALDINQTNTEINKLEAVKTATLQAASWSSAAPYTQAVSVAGITENDRPIVGLYLPDGIAVANVTLQEKAYACVNRAVSGVGRITVYCYNKKPTTDFQIQIKGV
jgi:hypothetical protein